MSATTEKCMEDIEGRKHLQSYQIMLDIYYQNTHGNIHAKFLDVDSSVC